ncbi:multidrug resistance protein [Stachybotrys elegans]|uniref:Multidrug resistance protein n=1 Tax=Stachybotrys elegans TaxID=80388 RepID=A0A8K0WUI8_9HYPO|nr:multidrug resistance protein [Stachybotrys elegans]
MAVGDDKSGGQANTTTNTSSIMEDVRAAPPSAENKESEGSVALAAEDKPTTSMASQAYRQMLTYFRLLFAADPTWVDVALVVVGVVVAAVAGTPFPIMAIVFGQLVDELNGATCAAQGTLDEDPSRYVAAVNDRILLMVYIAIAAFVAIYIYVLAWGIISQRLAQRLRRHYLAALLRQPPSYFDVNANAGEVSSRLHADITAIQAGTSEKAGIFIATISFFVTAFVIAFTRQVYLAAMLIFMVPCFIISAFVGGAFSHKYSTRMAEAMATASSLASEALRNISVVQAFGAGGRLESRFAELAFSARQDGTKKMRVSGVQAGMLYFIAYAGNALAFWQGSRFIAETLNASGSRTTMGDIYTVILVLVDACVMLGNIAPMMPLFTGASASFERLKKDMDAPSAIDATSDAGQVIASGDDAQPLAVHFNNVSFSYPSRPNQPVLKNVDLSFPAGKYTAIVGLSGSGKSTIASLITRLYDPLEGSVTVNGQDIRQLNVRSLRGQMGFVQQEPTLLNTSILANIALGLANSPKPEHQHLKQFLDWGNLTELTDKGKDIDASAATAGKEVAEIIQLVRHAAEQADAASFIERLESGYATMTGPAGSLVSGGQRQRLALAQALIRDPKILVLDEATASVDSATERRIQEAVERAAEGRTVISIAHRLSTIRNADNIIVMEAGRVVEQGSYAELMAIEGGVFAHMASLQTLGTADRNSLSGDTLESSSLKTDILSIDKQEIAPTPAEEVKQIDAPKNEPAEEKSDSSAAGELDTKRPISFLVARYGRIIRPSLMYLVFAIIAATIVGATFSSAGVIIGHIVGVLSPCANTAARIISQGGFFAGMIFMLAGVELFANFFSWTFFGLLAERLLYTARVLSFRSLMEQGLSWHQAMTSTTLLSVITKDTAAIGGFSGSTIGTVFSILVNFIIAVILSHIIAWRLAVVCLASVPILLGSGIIQLKMLAKYNERQSGAFDEATALAVETVHSIRTVAALSLEQQTMESFVRLLREPQKLIVKTAAFTNIWLAMHHSMGTFVYCLSYWWGTRLITRGEITQTQFFIVQIAMLVSAQLWGTMFALAPEFARARQAASRVLNVILLGSGSELNRATLQSLEPAKSSSEGGQTGDVEADAESSKLPQREKDQSRGMKVSFNNVSFTYPNRPGVPVLDNVSFTIQPGQFCGLVGPSGAGKSTIMSLVQRLYEPTKGSVMLDDKDLAPLHPSFRDSIALVPQDPTLFNGSVRFNISLGAPPGTEATDAEIEQACRLANIHDTIMSLPDGYDTECGSSAQRFSGGQRQRLAIARALVRKPKLLLLDESTSALDSASEAELQKGLERASAGTTVLAITHRLHTVQKADVILIVEGGKIVDSGKHSELMERRESYRINAMQQMLQ